jgi:hypothetical protein
MAASMSVPVQRPTIPAVTLGVLQARPVPQRPDGQPGNPHHRERPIIDASEPAQGAAPRRGQLVNILV